MRVRAGVLLSLAAALPGWPASATERPALVTWRTQSVAAFPDVVPGPPPKSAFPDVKPAPKPDASLELLSTNPYEAELSAALARQNLYGDDLANPYTDEVHLANPYTDELRFANPYSGQLRIARRDARDLTLANPYTSQLRSPRDHAAVVTSPIAPIQAPQPAPPAAPGTLAVETGAGFSGAVFVDGVGVPATGTGLSVLPGSHKVTVYPTGGTPFSVSVDVRPGASERVRLGR